MNFGKGVCAYARDVVVSQQNVFRVDGKLRDVCHEGVAAEHATSCTGTHDRTAWPR